MFEKQFNTSDIVNYSNRIQSKFSLTSESLQSVQFISQSLNSNYWNFFKYNYYDNTGSYPYTKSDVGFGFTGYAHQHSKVNGQYYNKYNISSSLIGISQKYFGDSIVPTTFKFVDNSLSSSIDNTIKPILLDDGKGNVYSSNAYVSQSTNHLSSSENHVGNIFYEYGIVVLKETGSWSGSVSYMDMAKGQYSVDFKSDNTLYTTEYNVRIEPDEFLHTNNPTSKLYGGDSKFKEAWQSPFYRAELTGSVTVKNGWTYITTIGLYDRTYSHKPLIVAKLAKPIKRDTSVPITFKLKLDKIY